METTASVAQPLLAMHDISKRYGGVHAIRDARLTIATGQVHALVGENGAGKSTLIKILSGAVTPDTGSILLDGNSVHIRSTTDSLALGIATVYQEPQLFTELTVAENIFMGRELRSGPFVDWKRQNTEVVRLLDLLGLPRSLSSTPTGELSIALQQQVSIAKALASDARILILDEPSAILTDTEIEVLFGVVRRLKAVGVSTIYISHRLDELFRIADEVTIMRDGTTLGTYPIQELSVSKIAEMVVGGHMDSTKAKRPAIDGTIRLQLKSLETEGRFHDVSLSVKRGEIVGLYGLVGSGATDIADAVYGMRRHTAGEILVDGERVEPRSPRDAQRLGVALLPGDRKSQGVFSFQSIGFNISIAHLRLLSVGGLWLNRLRERSVVRELLAQLSIKTPGPEQAVSALSGGNAQKVIIARLLVEQPNILVLIEPTQGVDVGSKEEIHRIVENLAADGTATLVISADLSEVQRVSDRIVVVRKGTIVGEFTAAAERSEILAAAGGAEVSEGNPK